MKTLTKLLFVSLTASCYAANRDGNLRLVKNAEFGISAQFSKDAIVCEAMSGDHPHGFYTILAGDCRNKNSDDRRSMSIWADYNTSGLDMNALERGYCPMVRQGPALGIGQLSIAGLQTKSCTSAKNSNELDVVLFAQRGSASQAYDDPTAIGGHINYVVSLTTSKQNLRRDLETFRRFVESVKLSPLE